MFPNWAGKKFFLAFSRKWSFCVSKKCLVQKGFLLILITLFEVQGSYWEYMFSMTVGTHVLGAFREKGHFGSLNKFNPKGLFVNTDHTF